MVIIISLPMFAPVLSVNDITLVLTTWSFQATHPSGKYNFCRVHPEVSGKTNKTSFKNKAPLAIIVFSTWIPVKVSFTMFLSKPRFPWNSSCNPSNIPVSLSFISWWNNKAEAKDPTFRKTDIPGFLRGFWTFVGFSSASRCNGKKITWTKHLPSQCVSGWKVATNCQT